jgi:hypothetical protein
MRNRSWFLGLAIALIPTLAPLALAVPAPPPPRPSPAAYRPVIRFASQALERAARDAQDATDRVTALLASRRAGSGAKATPPRAQATRASKPTKK